jgi:hypothetical protein
MHPSKPESVPDNVDLPPEPIDPKAAAKRFASMLRGFDRFLMFLVLALAFLLSSFAVRNPDFWLHLATGRDIVGGSLSTLFGHDPYSYATEGHHWVNHAWLFDVLIYLVYSGLGGSVLVILKAVCVSVIAGISMRTSLATRPTPENGGTRADLAGLLAAAFVGMAMIASAPRFLMHPAIGSFLMLAITISILFCRQWESGSRRLPLTLGVITLIWANVDSWALLAPALIALALIGALIQPETDTGRPKAKVLLFALGASLIGCLITPHHVLALVTLPQELALNPHVASLKNDPYHRLQFLSPLDVDYRERPEFGKSYAGFTYAALLVFGVVSFAVNLSRLRVSKLLVWLGLAGLSLINVRMIPFFAIGATPILVQNLVLATRRSSPASDSRAAATAGPSATGGVTITPEKVFAFAGLMVRLFSIVFAAFLLFAAYPGWLHPYARPWNVRRVAWELDPDRSLERATTRLGELRQAQKLPADVHGFHFGADFATYCAWYAPGEKCFFDYRYTLLGERTADLITIRKAMREIARTGQTELDWKSLFRKYKIRYLVLSNDSDRDEAILIGQLWLSSDWSLWYLDGRTSIFGWRDPESAPITTMAPIDLASSAFGASAERVPPPTRNLEADPELPSTRGFLQRYLYVAPQPSPDIRATDIYLGLREAAAQIATAQASNRQTIIRMTSEIGLSAGRTNWVPIFNPLRALADNREVQLDLAKRDSLTAMPLLAVRAARRGVITNPDYPESYLSLARAYGDFSTSPDIQQMQIVAALRQGIARVTAEDSYERWLAPLVSDAYLQLFNMHVRANRLDMALDALDQLVNRYNDHPPASIPAEQREGQGRYLEEFQKQLEKNVSSLRDNLELKTGNRLRERAMMALQTGLWKEAIAAMQQMEPKQLGIEGLSQLVTFMLQVGELDGDRGARALILSNDPDAVPAQWQPIFRQHRVFLAIIDGDLPRAGADLDKGFASMDRRQNRPQSNMQLAIVLHHAMLSGATGNGLLGWACHFPFWTAPIGALMARSAEELQYRMQTELPPIAAIGIEARQEADFRALRALVALEEGDNTTARKQFQQAIDTAGYLSFQNRGLTNRYLEALNRQVKKD